jgi:uncharacterized membrane protein YhaH (DUF805 family)
MRFTGFGLIVLSAIVAVAGAGGEGSLFALIVIPGYIVSVWIMLAGSVKRWHDLDKSGFWIFIAVLPVVGGLWEFIEAGCSRGTRGPNRYGPDPT